MIISILTHAFFYFTTGFLLYAFGVSAVLPDEPTVVTGFVMFWPLYLTKWILLGIFYLLFESAKFVRRNAAKWFVVPYTLTMVFINTGKHLFGIKKFKKVDYDVLGTKVGERYL